MHQNSSKWKSKPESWISRLEGRRKNAASYLELCILVLFIASCFYEMVYCAKIVHDLFMRVQNSLENWAALLTNVCRFVLIFCKIYFIHSSKLSFALFWCSKKSESNSGPSQNFFKIRRFLHCSWVCAHTVRDFHVWSISHCSKS